MSNIAKILENEFNIDATVQEQKRSAQRYRTKELAYLEVYGHAGKVFCKLENLSLSGASLSIVSSEYMPTVGDISKITVHLRTIKKTHIKPVEIIWSKNMNLGIRFLGREEVQKRINQKHL